VAWQWIGYARAGFEVVRIGAPGRSISRCDLVSKTGRVNLMHHRPAVLWLTGLGKSTIANLIEVALHVRSAPTIILDCDSVRMV